MVEIAKLSLFSAASAFGPDSIQLNKASRPAYIPKETAIDTTNTKVSFSAASPEFNVARDYKHKKKNLALILSDINKYTQISVNWTAFGFNTAKKTSTKIFGTILNAFAPAQAAAEAVDLLGLLGVVGNILSGTAAIFGGARTFERKKALKFLRQNVAILEKNGATQDKLFQDVISLTKVKFTAVEKWIKAKQLSKALSIGKGYTGAAIKFSLAMVAIIVAPLGWAGVGLAAAGTGWFASSKLLGLVSTFIEYRERKARAISKFFYLDDVKSWSLRHIKKRTKLLERLENVSTKSQRGTGLLMLQLGSAFKNLGKKGETLSSDATPLPSEAKIDGWFSKTSSFVEAGLGKIFSAMPQSWQTEARKDSLMTNIKDISSLVNDSIASPLKSFSSQINNTAASIAQKISGPLLKFGSHVQDSGVKLKNTPTREASELQALAQKKQTSIEGRRQWDNIEDMKKHGDIQLNKLKIENNIIKSGEEEDYSHQLKLLLQLLSADDLRSTADEFNEFKLKKVKKLRKKLARGEKLNENEKAALEKRKVNKVRKKLANGEKITREEFDLVLNAFFGAGARQMNKVLKKQFKTQESLHAMAKEIKSLPKDLEKARKLLESLKKKEHKSKDDNAKIGLLNEQIMRYEQTIEFLGGYLHCTPDELKEKLQTLNVTQNSDLEDITKALNGLRLSVIKEESANVQQG